MKKIFVFLLTVIILIGICSCGETTQLETNPSSNKTNESDITENNKDPNNSEPNNDKVNTEEYLSNVIISTEVKSHNYYSIINDESMDIPFPNKYGSYLKIILSKEEFSSFSDYEIDENIFNENYIVAINIHNEWIDDALKDIGFYNLNKRENEFFINVDYYISNDYKSSLEIPIEFNITKLLVVNKSEIDYFSEIQNITVNATKLKNEKIDLIGVTKETPIENYAYAYVIEDTEQNNEVMDKLHLNHHNWNDYLLLYMPDLNQYDFILKEKQIVEGDLYLTIEQYPHKDNAKFNEQGTGFYHIYEYPRDGSESKIDFDDLKENFNIYIMVCVVNVPRFSNLLTPNDNKDNLVEGQLPIVSYSHTQNDEYYSSAKFIRNVYYSNLSYEFGEWYKIVKSYEELAQIDSEITVDQAVFQENYILVVHRYYNGGLYYDYIGYKNARETEEGFEITLDCYEPEEAWTDECRYVESVEYLVVPKTELENVSVLEGKLTLNYGERNFYTRTWHYISEEKASELENGNVWIFENPTECVEFMEAYGVSHPIFGSALKDYTRVVIYFEKGTNIGIGYSNCNVTENEFYITNETLESDNVVLLEPALCVIIIPNPISVDEISDYNVIVQENVVERLYMAQGRTVATCCEQPNLVSYEIDNGDGITATLTYCTNEGCTYTLVDNDKR